MLTSAIHFYDVKTILHAVLIYKTCSSLPFWYMEVIGWNRWKRFSIKPAHELMYFWLKSKFQFILRYKFYSLLIDFRLDLQI